jgi:hypothetical protein
MQALTPADKVKREDGFIERLIFSDVATFHISSKGNRHNVRNRATICTEHQRDSTNINVFCAVSRENVHAPFLFIEATVTGDSFLDMLEI